MTTVPTSLHSHVAIVGLSDKPNRPSYQVAQYLLAQGFTIIPINPLATEILGQRAYPTLRAVPQDVRIDIVDVFRKPENVLDIIDDIIASGRKPVLWLQEGVGSLEAQSYAQRHGLNIVMDLCMMKEHRKHHTLPHLTHKTE